MITDVSVLWCWGEAIGVRVKVVRVHHTFARHQLIAFNFCLGPYSLPCLVSHNFVRIKEGDGSRLGLRMLKFLEDIAF